MDNEQRDQQAYDLKQQRKYGAARAIYEQLADAGDDDALWHLADFYERGLGVDKDLQMARSLLLDAARGQDPRIRFYLARFEERYGRPEDAFTIMHALHAEGFLPATFFLGTYYEAGLGVEKQVDRGRDLIRQAARAGHIFAARDLAGRLLKFDEGVVGFFKGIWQLQSIMRRMVTIASQDMWDERLLT